MRWGLTSHRNRRRPMLHRWRTTPDNRKRAVVTTTSSSSPTFRSLTPLVCHHNPSYHPTKAYPAQERRQRERQTHFATEVHRKTDAVRLMQVEHVNAERFILARIRHPFIVDLMPPSKVISPSTCSYLTSQVASCSLTFVGPNLSPQTLPGSTLLSSPSHPPLV